MHCDLFFLMRRLGLFLQEIFLPSYASVTCLYTIQEARFIATEQLNYVATRWRKLCNTGIDFSKRFFFYRKRHRPITYGHWWTLLWECISWNGESLEWTNHMSAYWHLNRVSSLDRNSKRTKRRDGHLCSSPSTAWFFPLKKRWV